MSRHDPAVLMLTTTYATHARHSGYGRLAEYVPGAVPVTAPRADPRGGLPLLAARVARRLAFSRWYLGGSASLEGQAWRHLRAGFRGIIHSLWADHDLGFLDLLTRQPVVGTFHNCPDDFVHTLRFPGRVRRFAAVVLMSACQRPFFLAAGVRPERLHVILHGVDTEYFSPPAEEHPAFSVLSAGGFRRNFPLLRAVAERLPEIPFTVIAPPAHREHFAGLPHVQFLSGLPDEELRAYYRRAGCLLHTAEQATANNVLLEAMACGRPIVAERLGGIPEYVTPAGSLLTEPGDAAALAEAVRTLASDATRRETMGRAARARAEELSWPQVAARMQALYRTLA